MISTSRGRVGLLRQLELPKRLASFFLHLPEPLSECFKLWTHAGYSSLPPIPRAEDYCHSGGGYVTLHFGKNSIFSLAR